MNTQLPSTRPYLIRAMHQWCTDHGFTPYLRVVVDPSVRVPRQHVVDGEIVLNVSLDATGGLNLGDEYIEFKARFGGVPQQVVVPVERVAAIYARENGQGMAFSVQASVLQGSSAYGDLARSVFSDDSGSVESVETDLPPTSSPRTSGGSRPNLKRIK